jgi:hypothetical protein
MLATHFIQEVLIYTYIFVTRNANSYINSAHLKTDFNIDVIYFILH